LALLGSVDAGGQNVHVAALAKGLKALGADVVVHTRRDDPSLPQRVTLPSGVVVEHVDAGPPVPIAKDELLAHMPAFADELERSWRRVRPDVVHAHFWMSGIIACEAALAVGVPVVETFHALGVVKRRHQGEADTSPPSRLDAERSLAAYVDSILATATDEVAELVAMGADRAKVSVVPCGVDVQRFIPRVGPAPRPNGRPRLLSLGRLVPRKGVDDAIRMLALLPDAELLVAGGPAPNELDQDEEVRRLQQVARESGVADRVDFLGSVSRDQVPELLRSADMAVCMPWYEPFGLVPLEAMACGVPVVGSHVGGLVDTIVDGRTGVLVPARRPELAARAVRELLDSPETLEAMGRRGALRVAQHYSWEQVARQTEESYGELLRTWRGAVAGAPLRTAAR